MPKPWREILDHQAAQAEFEKQFGAFSDVEACICGMVCCCSPDGEQFGFAVKAADGTLVKMVLPTAYVRRQLLINILATLDVAELRGTPTVGNA